MTGRPTYGRGARLAVRRPPAVAGGSGRNGLELAAQTGPTRTRRACAPPPKGSEPGAALSKLADRGVTEEGKRVLRVAAVVPKEGIETVIVGFTGRVGFGPEPLHRVVSGSGRRRRDLVPGDRIGQEARKAAKPAGPPQISGEYMAPTVSAIRKSYADFEPRVLR